MRKVTVVYHSGYGHTRNQAEAVLAGIDSVERVKSTLLFISPEGDLEVGEWDLLDNSDAIIFGSPTYMGMASWQFKKFTDASSKR
jgi:NAD(P)H dehydrogenase (quinone)